MGIGPWLIVRGTIIGSALLIMISGLVSRGADINNYPPITALHEMGDLAEPDAACGIDNKFPSKVIQWCDIINNYSRQFEIPPDLVASVIWQESGGNPRVVSRSGAVGLMQVMPRDGKAAEFVCVNGPCFENRPTMEQLRQPEFNIKYGTRMLASLYRRYGNWRDALKAYGPMDVGYSYADRVLTIRENYGVASE